MTVRSQAPPAGAVLKSGQAVQVRFTDEEPPPRRVKAPGVLGLTRAAAGARLHEGARVREVREVAGGVEVASDTGTFTAGMVVGAGGHGCPVARALGGARAEEHVVVTQESETRVGAERLRALTPRYGWPELIAEPDFKGYGWYFTKGDFLNIGVGALGGEPVRRRLERLLARLRTGGRLPDDLALTPFRGHAYAIRRGQPRRLILCPYCAERGRRTRDQRAAQQLLPAAGP